MTNQPYVQVALPIGEERFELAITALYAQGFESFLEDGDVLYAYVAESEWTREKEAEVQTLLRSLAGNDVALAITTIEPQNWNAEWERSLAPIEIDDWLVIVQSSKAFQPKPNQLVIEINPKMSFGTGYHETTRLMLRAMRDLVQPDDRILDIGTGTGVLAIVARKLGNLNPICACDNDEWAVLNAKENCEVNRVDGVEILRLDAPSGVESLLASRRFSLILANINRAVHEKLLPLLARLSPDSKVLLSGLLKYDLEWLNDSLVDLNFALARLWEEGEWICAFVKARTNHVAK